MAFLPVQVDDRCPPLNFLFIQILNSIQLNLLEISLDIWILAYKRPQSMLPTAKFMDKTTARIAPINRAGILAQAFSQPCGSILLGDESPHFLLDRIGIPLEEEETLTILGYLMNRLELKVQVYHSMLFVGDDPILGQH
jgi:hypothetical protein